MRLGRVRVVSTPKLEGIREGVVLKLRECEPLLEGHSETHMEALGTG